jgi:uncharacterized membrane protein YkvA (DUF1232 family)
MKVSSVKCTVSDLDILNIIEEYVIVKGLKINKVEINEFITVNGVYKKVVDIPFKAILGIGNIHNNIINIKVMNVYAGRLGIFTPVKNLALKSFLKDFSDNGLNVDKDTLIIDLNLITKVIPYVYFNLIAIKPISNALEIEIEELVYAPNKEIDSFGKKNIEAKTKHIKVQDNYSKARKNLNEKVDDKYTVIMEYAMIIPDMVVLFWRLFKDKRVSIKTKLLIGGIIAYLASPIDLLPDFIPFVGKIDDVAIAFFGMQKIMNEVPMEIILENWQGEDNIVIKVNEAVDYIYKVVGGPNVAKLIGFISNLGKKGKNEEEEKENIKEN